MAAATHEIAALQRDFDAMADALLRTTRDLSNTNAHLEQLVDARTVALREANALLEANLEALRSVDRLKGEFMAVVSHERSTATGSALWRWATARRALGGAISTLSLARRSSSTIPDGTGTPARSSSRKTGCGAGSRPGPKRGSSFHLSMLWHNWH